jgi:membrane fusion protein, multidrug efflux system
LSPQLAKLSSLAGSMAAMLLLVNGCARKEAPNAMMAMMMAQDVPVRAVPAKVCDVPLEFTAVGNAEALATVDVKSRVAGEVLRVYFQEGDPVKAGQLLFEIDPEPLQRQIAQIQADLAKDGALEQQARANVAKDEAQLKQTKAEAERALELEKEGIFSREQTEQVVATNDSALASLRADQAAVDSSIASEKSDHARLAQTQLQLTYTKITAPISGRAGSIAVKPGNLIKDNDAALVTLLQISPINVSFGVPEQLLPEVQKYNTAHPLEVEASAGSATAIGHLDFIDNNVDTTTGTIKLKARFENADRTLWPGEFVNVRGRLNLERDRVTIPSRTVQTGPQGKYVWVMNTADKSVVMRPVDVERIYKPPQGAELSVLKDGLKPGEMVISEGQMRLMPGIKVKVLAGESQS